jgi:hypothetical protein
MRFKNNTSWQMAVITLLFCNQNIATRLISIACIGRIHRLEQVAVTRTGGYL